MNVLVTLATTALGRIKKLKDIGVLPILGAVLSVYLVWSYQSRADTIEDLERDLQDSQIQYQAQARELQRVQEEYIAAQRVMLELEEEKIVIEEKTQNISDTMRQDISEIRSTIEKDLTPDEPRGDIEYVDHQSAIKERVIKRVGSRVLDGMWDAHCSATRDASHCSGSSTDDTG